MVGKEEAFIRCGYCGRLLHIDNLEPNQVYCKTCKSTFDVEECDVVLRGICVPSDYHYEWKEEQNLAYELAKYKRAFEILKKNIVPNQDVESLIDIMVWREDNKEEYELLEELMKDESR